MNCPTLTRAQTLAYGCAPSPTASDTVPLSNHAAFFGALLAVAVLVACWCQVRRDWSGQ